MRRLSVPEWLIDIVFSLDNEAQVSILTAHGLSVPFHPETSAKNNKAAGTAMIDSTKCCHAARLITSSSIYIIKSR